MLYDSHPIDGNTINLINNYFRQLIDPVCLVAHNGNSFDYPIVKSYLQKRVIIKKKKLF